LAAGPSAQARGEPSVDGFANVPLAARLAASSVDGAVGRGHNWSVAAHLLKAYDYTRLKN